MLDPLAVFLRNTFDERGLTPIPLISTDHDVVIASGLAVVTTHRLFKNVEPKNIEAVLTFPLPVLATLFELTAEVDGRKLRASSQARSEARRAANALQDADAAEWIMTRDGALVCSQADVDHEAVQRAIRCGGVPPSKRFST